MKMRSVVVMGGVLLAGVITAQAGIYTENFQSGYTAGNLPGQNSWAIGKGATATSSVILASGNYYVSSVDNAYSIKDNGNYGLTTSDKITLTFDLYVSAANANASFGIGNYNPDSSTSGTPAIFGVQSGNWTVRGWGFGTATIARNNSGVAIAATTGKWYRVKSDWDLSGTGSGTLSIMNLTDGETEYTQLFFDAAQTTATADLQLDSANNPGVGNWQGVFVRTQNAQVDNLSVIPEPATLGLFVISGVSVFLVRHYSRS